MKKMLKEFKEFAMRGNAVDLAVGLVIGASFGKIVSTLVNEILMPPIGLLTGGVDFKNLSVTIKAAALDASGKEIPAVVIGYGAFINTVIDFIIVAFAMFLIVKAMNSLKRKEAAAPAPVPPPAPPRQELLLEEIRDLLKNNPRSGD